MVTKTMKLPPFFKQCFVTASVAINIIGQSCVLGYPAILLPQLNTEGSPLQLDPESASWLISIIGITQLIGSIITPPIMGRYGRKIAHFASTAPNIAGWITIALATNFETLFAARIIQGLSIGMLAPLRSVLIGEYTSPKYRGAFLTTVSLSQSFGIFLVHVLGSFLTWQVTAWIALAFPLVSFFMTIYSPETPSWLVDKNRFEECRTVFHWLRGDDEDEELEEMINAKMYLEKERATELYVKKVNYFRYMLEAIQKPEFYKPIILMVHAHALINFAGGMTMTAYSTYVILIVMGPETNAYFWMIFFGAQRFVSNILAIFAINKFKRRTMMFATGGISIFVQFALAVYMYLKQTNILTYEAIWLPALLLNLKIFGVATGMLPLPTIIGGEVFPLEYRSLGGLISLASYSLTYFLVLKTFTGLVDAVTMAGAYVVYGVIISYCMVVIWWLLPETKGRTLQQIEDIFRGRSLAPKEVEPMALGNAKSQRSV